ncbi:carboxylate-amine ligase [Gordonia amicalis]|uniref:carboxylate-amine ligase n=1 Tax=Gordonia amicalis TaxID=89053 RepID=UPI0002A64BA8|nr:glutamate--cysteine ligase [Gordonia amicalis]UOG22190.1 glutamate--cysteine ligase [Gordonia amicalis]GAC53461.1 carboxylate-amine ligase [Gordonia amicalis NBRC 100051 = JCM 11271]
MAGQVPPLGVEEEFVLVDRETARPVARNREVAAAASARGLDLALELTSCQVEIATPTSDTAKEIGDHLYRLRSIVAAAADDVGVDVVACGLPPRVPESFPVTDTPRYRAMAGRYGMLAHEQGINGCHVHVGVPDRDAAVAVCNWLRPWLPALLALTANSAIYRDADSGHASWRSVLWSRWPAAGPPPHLRSAAHFAELVELLVATGVILDPHMLYWDARPSDHLPTVEIRAADVQMRVDEARAFATIVRAAVMTALDDVERGAESVSATLDPMVLAAAYWKAAHDGLDGDALDPVTGGRMPAWTRISELVTVVGPALNRLGQREEVDAALRRTWSEGNGASRQRRIFRETHSAPAITRAATVRVDR